MASSCGGSEEAGLALPCWKKGSGFGVMLEVSCSTESGEDKGLHNQSFLLKRVWKFGAKMKLDKRNKRKGWNLL